MSSSPISRSPDLQALSADGWHLEVRGGYLIVRDVPYVTASGEIAHDELVTPLELRGGTTQPPPDHTIWWTGGTPHTASGVNMQDYLCCSVWPHGYDIGEGILVYQQWSRRVKSDGRTRPYRDYREKITTYIHEVADHAEAQRPGILTALASAPLAQVRIPSSRFAYLDTNAYRNGTKAIEKKVEDEIVAVVGVGGTGSYLVDILAKTNVREVHLYDDDVLDVPNAFRVAGAARKSEVGGSLSKVEWHRERYGEVRIEGLHIHPIKVSEENIGCLASCTTVFIAVDDIEVRRELQRACNRLGKLHISVGIGLEVEGDHNDQIDGMVKVETHYVPVREELSAVDEDVCVPGGAGVYESNIQTAEVNMLGAAMAVVEWKAVRGLYRCERDRTHDSKVYATATGRVLSGTTGQARRIPGP